MHKYFLIPVTVFFAIISLIVFYLQYIYEDWKFDVIGIKKEVPIYCNDLNKVEIISDSKDDLQGRSFKDQIDKSLKHQFHAIYLLPCDEIDRKFDVNKNIEYSINSINQWFLDRTKNQLINFDRTISNNIDVTFLRVNKSMKWFTKFSTQENNKKDTSSKIEKIILSNANYFNNFKNKKFLVFFEGWEKRNSLFIDVCGKSRFNGKVAIFYTNGKWKKIADKNQKDFSCTKDNLNNSENDEFGESEETILHEILHTLGAPPKCGKNLDPENKFHVADSNKDILYKVSGNMYLDFNNDDYYKHNIENCPDLSQNKYLIDTN